MTMLIVGQFPKLPVSENFDIDEEVGKMNGSFENQPREISEKMKRIDNSEETEFIKQIDSLIEEEIPIGFLTPKSRKNRKRLLGW
ncbi:MAG: hypothetical protein PHT84_04945 [Candidatus Pacebacteria bacterium]|nr:hypothetical protein [Candidatus Paceibacterota bacterium]